MVEGEGESRDGGVVVGTLGSVQEKVISSSAELFRSKKKQFSSDGSTPLIVQRNVEQ